MKRLLASRYQRHFYLWWQLGHITNNNLTYEIEGALDVDVLLRTLTALCKDHEFLKTTFSKEDDCLYQDIHQDCSFELELYDVSQEPAEHKQQAFEALLDEIYNVKFDLGALPLVRFFLVQHAQDRFTFIMSGHHIITDALIISFMAQFISDKYNELAFNRESSKLDIPVMEDYIDYEIAHYSSKKEIDGLTYWAECLSGVPLHLDLEVPAESQKPVDPKDIATYFSLDDDLSKALRATAHDLGSTSFVLISAIFAMLLAHYTGQQRFVLTFPINMRPKGFEKLLGSFINTSFLIIDIDPQMSLSRFVASLTAQRHRSKSHQDIAFMDVLEELLRNVSGESHQLFNITITPGTRLVSLPLLLEGCDVKGVPVNAHDDGDINLSYQLDNGFDFRLDDLKGFFNKGKDSCFSRDFIAVLRQFMNNSHALIQDMSMGEENTKLTSYAAENIAIDFGSDDELLHRRFEWWADCHPEDNVIINNGICYSYSDLNGKANRLARLLQKKHVEQTGGQLQPGTMIGVCLGRSFDLMVALLAIIKAGGAYVPLDPSYPKQRLQYMIEDCDPWAIVTTTEVLATDLLDDVATSRQLIALNDTHIESALQGMAVDNLDEPVKANDLMYAIYTSGSTGKPKAVSIYHGSVSNVLSNFKSILNVVPEDRLLSVSSMNFDIFVLEFGLPMSAGACCILPSDDERMDMLAVKSLFAEYQPTILQATPSWWQYAMSSIPDNSQQLRILVGGEVLSYQLKERLLKKTLSVWNVYGPTEATIWSTAHLCVPGEPVLIGGAVTGASVYILDNNKETCPVGVAGEIYIQGLGLAQCYLNQDDLTDSHFINYAPDEELNSAAGFRIYKTGDRGRWLQSGDIEYLGRKDTQVKFRGYRVELGEVEQALLDYPDVTQAVVIVDVVEDKQQMRAYVTLSIADNVFDVNACYAYLQQSLPAYMLPEQVIMLESMPLTATGKLDRSTLIMSKVSDTQADFVPPKSALERRLALLWCQVLRCARVGITDNFYRMGGNSIKSIQLIGLARDQQLFLTPQLLLQYPTVELLARYYSESIDDLEPGSHVIRQAMNLIDTPILEVNSGGEKQPIFMIHPGAGGAFTLCRDLAIHLGKDQPCYIVDSYNLYHLDQPKASIEQLAEHYIKAIELIQPEGPYMLLGWSLGGLIAYEVSRQLQVRDATVKKMVLIDSVLLSKKQARMITRMWDKKLIKQGLRAALDAKDQFTVQTLESLYGIEHEMRQQYHPSLLNDVDVLLLRANQAAATEVEEVNDAVAIYRRVICSDDNGWGDVIQQLSVANIDADHLSIMLSPAVDNVVGLIQSHFDSAE